MTLDCKASIGLSYTEGAESAHTLVRQADNALYETKDQGRGRWTEHHQMSIPIAPDTQRSSHAGYGPDRWAAGVVARPVGARGRATSRIRLYPHQIASRVENSNVCCASPYRPRRRPRIFAANMM